MILESTRPPRKAILISRDPGPELPLHIAHIDLPKRALSLPVDSAAASELPSFVELWGEETRLRSIVQNWPFRARAWLVEEHVPLSYRRDWPSGSESPGLRMVGSLHRRWGMSQKAFADYWLGPHTEVARSYTIPCWHYNQNVVTESLCGDSGEDGFVGMHFETRAYFEARWAKYPEEAARGAEDASRFMDRERSITMVAVETVWEEPTTSGP